MTRRRAIVRWLAFVLLAVLAACGPVPKPAADLPSPLDALNEAELTAAIKQLQTDPRFPKSWRIAFLRLAEPPKSWDFRNPPPRQAEAGVYDEAANRLFDVLVDLSAGRIVSWQDRGAAQPPLGGSDSTYAAELLAKDPAWAKALEKRQLSVEEVAAMTWTSGDGRRSFSTDHRVVRAVPYWWKGATTPDMRPIEGLVAEVDLTARRVLRVIDTGTVPAPPRDHWEAPFTRPVAPEWPRVPASGLTATIQNGEVQWRGWRFRFTVDPREGLILRWVRFLDRPVLYRASVAEMAVPYADPDPVWNFRNALDAGELGLGLAAASHRRGYDAPPHAQYSPAAMADEKANITIVRDAVAVYEMDGGLAWRHGETAARARELHLSFVANPGNYDYLFQWIFHEDGTLEARIALTGIMAAKGVAADGHALHSHLVAPNLAAVHHQHFFCYRLDFDIDGPEANRVVEWNAQPGKGMDFSLEETPLAQEGARNLQFASARRWKVESTRSGHPGYLLLPGENSPAFAQADSVVRRRASFLDGQFWVTPFAAGERYPAGDYPLLSAGGEGLAKWTKQGRAVENTDVVLWYVLGVTHVPRPEEWPVMPVHEAGFKLAPVGFVSRNPVFDLRRSP